MKRVFLSHSSSDKQGYLEIVVKNLEKTISRDKFVYDAVTFEEGLETEMEILKWLEQTDLFVLFISDKALNSPWVIREILEAKDLHDNKLINKIYPIIIDSSINYKDDRIPEWMKETYNIRTISKPSIAARKIYNRMIEISWEKNPRLKEKQSLFAGRNDLVNSIEERIDSFEKPFPTTLIASGLKDIGRRTLLRRGLIKSNVILDSYYMPSISLDAHQSIEDFILFLRDLGYGEETDGQNLLSITQEAKIDIALNMLIELKNSKDILLVIDEGAVVSPVREISDWFINLNKKLEEKHTGLVMCVVSKYKTSYRHLYKAESIYAIDVPGLSRVEASGLFTRYCRIINLDLSIDDIKYISSFFSGLPREILYTADYIAHHNVADLKRNTGIITDFSDNQVSRLISQYEDNTYAKNMLALISTFDFISYSLLYKVTKEKSQYIELVEEFLARGICENLGSDGEYICLNLAIKNYIRRQKIDIDEEIEKALNMHVTDFIENYIDDGGRDISDIFFSIRSAITEGQSIDKRYLIPSHYLKSMKELYDRRDKDPDVIVLADRILEHEEFMDDQIAREIRYFLCSSLARLKQERFKEEVQKIKGAEHNFLFGFYYRHVGRDEDAVNSLLKALEERQNFARAKRELVLVYNNMEEYDKALELAKENYQQNRNNEYHIQAYFQCLSYGKGEKVSFEERKRNIQVLLDDMSKIESEKAKNMFLIMSAQYNLYFEDNIEKAKSIIQKAHDLYPNDTYVLLCMFDICEKALDIPKLERTLNSLKAAHGNSKSKYHREYLKSSAIYKAIKGDISAAKEIVNKLNISTSSKKNLEMRIERISKQYVERES